MNSRVTTVAPNETNTANTQHYLTLIKPLTNVTREAGGNIRLKCEFAGNPLPKVQWYKHEAPIEPEKGKIQIRSTRMRGEHHDRVRARLLINRLDTHDIGFYKCEASNGYKIVDSVAVLMVKAGAYYVIKRIYSVITLTINDG